MKLPQLAIRYHQFTLIIITLCFISGVIAFVTMPRSEDPQISPKGAVVVVLYPGANPADMEQLVVDPVEAKLNELDNIKKINSFSGNGLASIDIEFLSGIDMDDTFSKITQKIGSIRDQLPTDIMQLNITRYNLSDFVIILQLALLAENESFSRLNGELEGLEKILRRIPGIKRVKKWAVPEREVAIEVDLEKLAAYRIPFKQVLGAIQAGNLNIPGGNINLGSKRFSIKTNGSYRTLEQIRDTIIQIYPDHPLYLKDVATVRFSEKENEYLARVNGRRAVFLTVNQKEGSNIFTVMGAVKKSVQDFSRKLPPTMELYYAFDQSQSVRYRLNNFFNSLFKGLVLVGLIILLGEGLWAAGIVMTVIPLSIFIGIALIHLCGYGLEQMSISGLVIALGMIVDNAIVVTQNISRFIRNGYDRMGAAVAGTAQIGWPIISSTLTTVFAFLPLVMMQDETGEYIRSMPLIVIFTLMVSLLLALTLTPFLASRFLPLEEKNNRFQRGMSNWIEKRFGLFLDKALQRPKRVLLIAGGILLFSLCLTPFVGVSYFPKADKSQFMINISLPQGSSLDKTDQVTRSVEKILEKIKEIRTYASNVGRGNPQIHFSIDSPEYDLSFAQIFVELKKNDLRFMAGLIKGLRKRFAGYPGAKIEVKEIELGPPVKAPIEIKILGEKMRMLTDLAAKAENIFVLVPGTMNVKNPQAEPATDLAIRINSDKAGMLGISMADINTIIRTSVAGTSISRFRSEEGKEYDITVRLPIDHAFRLSDFDRIMVPSMSGVAIPLKQVAQLEFASSAKEINHYNFERSISISADVLPGYNVEQVTGAIVSKLEKLSWPAGYHFHVAGERESREEAFGGMGKAALIALMAIFALLVLQFKSLAQPFIVFAAIPLAVVGSILALLLFGYTFSFVAFVGLTSLFGIVINCSIILVDYANQLVKNEGMTVHEAVLEAAKTRFMPIFLTTATTVLGLIPLAIQGGSLFTPMSLVMIGGLITSSVLSLVVVPALYKIFTREIR